MPTKFNEERLEMVVNTIKAIAHPARIKIVDLLSEAEKSVSELCEELNYPQPYVSQQLAIMKSHGILRCRRKGQMKIYSLANPHVIKIIQCVKAQAALHD